MRILVLLSRVPYPLEKGDKLRAFEQIKRLSQKHEIILCCLSDQKLHRDALRVLQPFCKEIYVIRINKVEILLSLFLGLFSSRPFQVSYFYHIRAKKIIERLIEKHIPKHIYCQLVRVTEYVKKYTILPKTLDYMDAFSAGVKRRIDKVPFYIRPAFILEAKRMEKYEKEIFDRFQNRTIISAQDRELIRHPHSNEIKVIPNGVDTTFFHPPGCHPQGWQPVNSEKDYDLLFTGNMAYPPNVESACYIVNEIIPLLRKNHPDIRLLISGANPSHRVNQLKSQNVAISGWVDDMRNSYSRSKIFIAPMQTGTGMQNKLLEAMAMRLPCVTSSLANNAIGAKVNEQILLGNTPREYAGHVEHLLNDRKFYSIIADGGYHYVINSFNWDTTTAELEKLISQNSIPSQF